MATNSQQNRQILCIGEAIVDLICERNLQAGEGPDTFIPHPGGALANVAVAISRGGHPAAMAGGVGDDHWGRWLNAELGQQGVAIEWMAEVKGADTPVGIVRFGADNEPDFQIYGEHIAPTMLAAQPRLQDAIGRSGGVVIGSNTMVGPVEREVTRQAIEISHDHGVPVLFDPNFRPNRWDDRKLAVDYCRELTGASALIKCNRGEATLITGEDDPLEAARQLASFGPRLAVVTDGSGRVVTAGAVEAEHLPPEVTVVSPLGAGDAFMGNLCAGLAGLGWDFSRAGEALASASAAGAAACQHWAAQS